MLYDKTIPVPSAGSPAGTIIPSAQSGDTQLDGLIHASFNSSNMEFHTFTACNLVVGGCNIEDFIDEIKTDRLLLDALSNEHFIEGSVTSNKLDPGFILPVSIGGTGGDTSSVPAGRIAIGDEENPLIFSQVFEWNNQTSDLHNAGDVHLHDPDGTGSFPISKKPGVNAIVTEIHHGNTPFSYCNLDLVTGYNLGVQPTVSLTLSNSTATYEVAFDMEVTAGSSPIKDVRVGIYDGYWSPRLMPIELARFEREPLKSNVIDVDDSRQSGFHSNVVIDVGGSNQLRLYNGCVTAMDYRGNFSMVHPQILITSPIRDIQDTFRNLEADFTAGAHNLNFDFAINRYPKDQTIYIAAVSNTLPGRPPIEGFDLERENSPNPNPDQDNNLYFANTSAQHNYVLTDVFDEQGNFLHSDNLDGVSFLYVNYAGTGIAEFIPFQIDVPPPTTAVVGTGGNDNVTIEEDGSITNNETGTVGNTYQAPPTNTLDNNEVNFVIPISTEEDPIYTGPEYLIYGNFRVISTESSGDVFLVFFRTKDENGNDLIVPTNDQVRQDIASYCNVTTFVDEG